MEERHWENPQASQLRPERIRTVLEGYFSPLPDHVEDKVWNYMNLLELWGKRMPLTSIRDPEQIVRLHFGESIFALSLVGDRHGRLADVGSGAGFPGLALKLAAPDLHVTLIESNKKKCAFLHEVVRELSVREADVVPVPFSSARIEDGSLSFVTCRALGQHQAVMKWATAKLKPHGFALLWLGREDSAQISRTAGWTWDEPRLIPRTTGRFILMGAPMV